MKIELPCVKLKFTFRMEEELVLPFYAGSAFRGVFGSSLRRLCCLSGKKTCDGCGLTSSCPYAVVFESKEGVIGRPTNPYVIEPPLLKERVVKKGETLVFHQILFGDAVQKLSFILLAWSRGFRFGMGVNRAKAVLEAVHQVLPSEEVYIYGQEDDSMYPVEPIYPLEIPEREDISLSIQTPMRIQRNHHPIVPADLTFCDFISSLSRRIELLYEGHTKMPHFVADRKRLIELASSAQEELRDLRWWDWTRWSGRQQTHIALGGVVGEWRLKGVAPELLPMLYAGEILHLGKSTVMGMGKYVIL